MRQDLISRCELFNRLAPVQTLAEAYAVIQDMPTEEQRTGKWIVYNTEQDGWKRTDGSPVFMSCSECNGLVLNNGSAHWSFCPNCGADMRGDKDENKNS